MLISNLKPKQLLLFLFPNKKNTGTTENIAPSDITGNFILTSSTLKPGNTIPLQVLTKTIRSNFGVHNDPNTFEKLTTQDNSFDVTSFQFQVQNTETLPSSQYNGEQRIKLM